MKSLHAKIASALLAVLLLLGVVHFAIHRLVTYPSFLELERRQAALSTKRVVTAIEQEVVFLDTTCKDWAFWDDSLDFVRRRTPEFIGSNLQPTTFVSNRLDLITFLDNHGETVWSGSYDWHNGALLPAIRLPYAELAASLNMENGVRNAGRNGLVITPDGPLLIAVRPILPSVGEGPVGGTLIMGRLLDEAFRVNLQELTLVPLRLTPVQPTVPIGVDVSLFSDQIGPLLETSSSTTLTASVLLRDLFDRPALLLAADLPRDISAYGRRTAGIALHFFWGSAIVVLVLLTLLLRHIILKPMKQLTFLALEVRKQGDLSLRIDLQRDDEVGTMAAAFNDMLALIARQTAELERKNDELRADAHRRQQAEEALLQLDRMKNEFISAAAHELNTPLAAIMGYTEILCNPGMFGTFSEEQKQDFLAEIHGCGEALEKVISDLLDISHLESGQEIRLHRTAVDLRDLMTRLLRRYQLLSPRHAFVAVIGDDLPATIPLDEYRMSQVLENLLSNAVKYAPQGGAITLRAIRQNDQAQLSVSDEGIGMNDEQLGRVFDKFYRADASNTAVRGLGLGMSIVRRIVEAHHGRIVIASRPGDGTTVTVSLPLEG